MALSQPRITTESHQCYALGCVLKMVAEYGIAHVFATRLVERAEMASLKEHCEDCRRELGEDFKHVHEWLDALFKVLGPKHRSARHHTGGVEEVRKMWGDRAALAAEIHIRKDYRGGLPSKKEVQLWGIFGPPEK